MFLSLVGGRMTGSVIRASLAGAIAVAAVAATHSTVAPANALPSSSGLQGSVDQHGSQQLGSFDPARPLGSVASGNEAGMAHEQVVNANTNPAAARKLPETFDLEAHRGGRGENTEESRQAFEHALDLGVTTLELDVVMTKDGVPMVWHDPSIQPDKCSDTEPVQEGDPQFPYVGKLVKDLTWEQIQTLNCDKTLEDFPKATPAKGNKPLQLSDVFELAKRDPNVHFNIETKVEGEKREQSKEPMEFVDAILRDVRAAGVQDRVMIQSFDWRTLPMVRDAEPDMPLALLWDDTTWKQGTPWSGPVDYDAVGGDVVKAAQQLDAQVLSPGHAVPYGSSPEDADYKPTFTPELVDKAHAAGLFAVPWTVNKETTMNEQIDAGVDGLISDYPTLLVSVLKSRGVSFHA